MNRLRLFFLLVCHERNIQNFGDSRRYLAGVDNASALHFAQMLYALSESHQPGLVASLYLLAMLCPRRLWVHLATVGMADRQLVFVKEGFQFAARLMHGSYVDTDSLIAGTQNTFTVLSDSEELRRTLQAATAACMDNRTILHFDGNRLTLRCTGEVGSSNAALTVIPLTGQPAGDYCFAVDRLDRCLRALRGTVTLGIAQTGMLTLSTEDAFYMQTQLRMTASKAKSARKKAAKAA